jgi:hypothetical protein
MALEKSIQHPTGASSSYWRVTRISLDYERKTASISLAGYFNQQARIDNKRPLDTKQFNVMNTTFNQYFSPEELNNNVNPVKQSYIYIKTLPELSDATDV